jgi:hypothetical protein
MGNDEAMAPRSRGCFRARRRLPGAAVVLASDDEQASRVSRHGLRNSRIAIVITAPAKPLLLVQGDREFRIHPAK